MSATKIRSLIASHFRENPDDLDKLLAKNFVPPDQRKDLGRLLNDVLETIPDQQLLETLQDEIFPAHAAIEKVPDIIKSEQIKSLIGNLSEQPRAQAHIDRSYTIFGADDGGFILPDTTLAFVKQKGLSPFSRKGDEIVAVIVPISSSSAIIGRHGSAFDHPIKSLNRMLASCSYRSFLAKSNAPSFQGLTSRIGRYAHIFTDREVENAVASLKE